MKPHVFWLFLVPTVLALTQSETSTSRDEIAVPEWKSATICDATRHKLEENKNLLLNNRCLTSTAVDLRPPFFLHTDNLWSWNDPLLYWRRAFNVKRSYQCPTGTTNCSTIGRPNSCCGQGQQCMLVQNTGSGDVGCCPYGSTCGGAIASCNTEGGYTACPGSSNGGCCIPGYTCDSIGCIATGTTTTRVSGSTIYIVSNSLASTIVSTTTATNQQNIVSTPATTTTIVSTTTVTPVIQRSTYYSTTTTPTSTTTLSASGFTATATTITTVTASPAVLATTNSENQSSSVIAGTCAAGYYQCSAFVQLCCQIGFGCESSSCLTTASSTTVVTGSAVTVVVVIGSGVSTVTPRSSGQASTTTIAAGTSRNTAISTNTISSTFGLGICATGWYSCDATNGGGCCPSGYSCAASCIATQTGIPNHVYKVAPSAANSANSIPPRVGQLIYALALMTMTVAACL